MNILWFSWKDVHNPAAGGAEIITDSLLSRLSITGNSVTLITSKFRGSLKEQSYNGYRIIRCGNRFSVYFFAPFIYFMRFHKSTDFIIEEINTIPFFTDIYTKKKKLLFFHQLCKAVWFYQMPLPIAIIGYSLEMVYLRCLNHLPAITISKSSKADLLAHGFKSNQTYLIRESIDMPKVSDTISRNLDCPILLSIGSIRSMKRTDHVLEAFEYAKKTIPNLRLVIAGKPVGKFGNIFLKKIRSSPVSSDIQFLGSVDKETKKELFRTAAVTLVTSVKEGWCLVVTEANSQGSVAIVYNVDGLRDSVINGVTGIVCESNTPAELGSQIIRLLRDTDLYKIYQSNSLAYSKQFTVENSFNDFLSVLKKYE